MGLYLKQRVTLLREALAAGMLCVVCVRLCVRVRMCAHACAGDLAAKVHLHKGP